MNFRRIFEERALDVHGRVLGREQLCLFSDLAPWSIREEHAAVLIQRAEALLGATYEPLLATEYMMYRRCGNRSVFEQKFFARRQSLLTLAVAEWLEDRGRFTDAIADLVWLILEETTWVVPAHNPPKDGVPVPLPFAFRDPVTHIDLFSATTAADLALAYSMTEKKLDAISPLICERVRFELDRRIVRPFLDPALQRGMWWTGERGERVNNWNPWILSNLLTVAAVAIDDMAVREQMTDTALRMLNAFTAVYHDDGGCDEGPSYWGAAGAALYDACCLLYDLTGGYIDVFDDPLLRRMGEYKPAVHVVGQRFLNFADSPATVSPTAALVYDWGVRCGSEPMKSFGAHFLDGGLTSSTLENFHPYRSLRLLTLPPLPRAELIAPRHVYLDGVTVAVSRECERSGEGLYLAFKGGHNNESHNHNDVGTVTVFADGRPLLIDAGCATYTARTFSPRRYEIWSMRSEYHNLPTVNGCLQKTGNDAASANPRYENESGRLTLDLTAAYPAEAGLRSYERSAVLADGQITLTDTLSFRTAGTVDEHFLLAEQPQVIAPGQIRIAGRTLAFDPTLTVRVEPTEHEEPEVKNIAASWGAPCLYRLTLSAEEPREALTLTFTIR